MKTFILSASLVAICSPAFADSWEQYSDQAKEAAQVSFVHGTLIVALPCKDGLLIMSDKRQNDTAAGTYHDDGTKVNSSDKFTAFACTNQTHLVYRHPKTGHDFYLYDPNDILFRYLSAHPISGRLKTHKSEIEEVLKKSFLAAFEERPLSKWPHYGESNIPLFTATLFHFDEPRKQFQIMTINFKYTPPAGMQKAIIDFETVERPEYPVELADPYVTGDAISPEQFIAKAGLQAARRAFSATNAVPKASDVPLPKAESTAARLIYETAALQEKKTISETVDTALIRPTTGFEMLQKNVPSKSLIVDEAPSAR